MAAGPRFREYKAMNEPIAVVGAGLMGAGIAGEFARGGYAVNLVDTDEEALERGLNQALQAQRTLVEVGAIDEQSADAATKRIKPTTSLEVACADAEILIEAVHEELSLKQRLFGKFDELCPKDAILASNTSGLSISKIAGATARPEQVVGVHFWNPPHVVPLVEVTKGESTSDATADRILSICKSLGKKPILVRHDIPGFVGNRLQFAVFREALHLLEEGVATPEDIDLAMTAGPGLRYSMLGPLRTADLGGLDVFYAVGNYLTPELSGATSSSPVIKELIDSGRLGAKSGAGFYRYSEAELEQRLARRDRVLLRFLELLDNDGEGG